MPKRPAGYQKGDYTYEEWEKEQKEKKAKRKRGAQKATATKRSKAAAKQPITPRKRGVRKLANSRGNMSSGPQINMSSNSPKTVGNEVSRSSGGGRSANSQRKIGQSKGLSTGPKHVGSHSTPKVNRDYSVKSMSNHAKSGLKTLAKRAGALGAAYTAGEVIAKGFEMAGDKKISDAKKQIGIGSKGTGGRSGRVFEKPTVSSTEAQPKSTPQTSSARETPAPAAQPNTVSPAKSTPPKQSKATGTQKVTGKGSKTVDTKRGKLANVTKEQLASSGMSLRGYMNEWNKTGKRPGYTEEKKKNIKKYNRGNP